jgi:type I site-specific restriction-modification system R (restriction) subunit
MTQAVEDGATRPVYYESRVIHLKLDEDILRMIDAEYDIMAANAEPYAIEKSKKELGRMESILGAEQTITAQCEDIVAHYEENREHELTGKAMIVAYSRTIAMRIYDKMLEIRPDWTQKLGVVMTSSNKDDESWKAVIGNKRHKEEMAKKFKDNDDPLKIAIVVDMWLTGFDVPSLATMYVYKPMAGHNLMQAIARINELLKASIKSEGVINLFSDVDTGFSLFDPKFLEEISKMKEKNLAVEILRKLLAEQVAIYKRTNLVKSEKFSEMLSRAMRSYLNGMISNEEVIADLMKMAKDMAAGSTEGDDLGLIDEEVAFYDALTRPEAIKDIYHNEDLVALTHELTEMLRRSRTIDWKKKESARAGMRRMVKKLLKKYRYPPEGMEDAIATVIGQCEMWTDNVS